MVDDSDDGVDDEEDEEDEEYDDDKLLVAVTVPVFVPVAVPVPVDLPLAVGDTESITTASFGPYSRLISDSDKLSSRVCDLSSCTSSTYNAWNHTKRGKSVRGVGFRVTGTPITKMKEHPK